MPLRLVNTDLAPVTLYKGTNLANAETINEGNVSVVANVNNQDTSRRTSVPQTLLDSQMMSARFNKTSS